MKSPIHYRHLLGSTTAHRRMFWAFVSFIFILVSLYVYFLSASVMNVIVREEMEQRIVHAGARVSELELTYLQKKNAVTPTLAKRMGFRKTEGKTYVTRTSAANRLTLHEE